ncbi:hypothetical protein ppKF707_4805 [Metapseudomonas furukawaii]|uniref:Uncharacterized protein n=1 Tax=Metapseudomonas furukawaii TaxID=1149133 RepID=A0AAD1C0G6_METFU|nr:hypothetical protein ppKF707_4805 [Pseudomonas furukawaii]BAU74693.1 hypothetical protein KF707C_30050 [Pseudomonas furukawaii]
MKDAPTIHHMPMGIGPDVRMPARDGLYPAAYGQCIGPSLA